MLCLTKELFGCGLFAVGVLAGLGVGAATTVIVRTYLETISDMTKNLVVIVLSRLLLYPRLRGKEASDCLVFLRQEGRGDVRIFTYLVCT